MKCQASLTSFHIKDSQIHTKSLKHLEFEAQLWTKESSHFVSHFWLYNLWQQCAVSVCLTQWFQGDLLFRGHCTSTCWELNKTSIFHYCSGNHIVVEWTTVPMWQKIPSLPYESKWVFFHLFLMEKEGIKGQFLTLKVGANSVFFPVLG